MDFVISAVELNLIGKLIYNELYVWIQSWNINSGVIGAFAVTVIMFTLFLKLITTPLDLWQKFLTRKNALKMELMKPELDKITKQCGDNRELLMQKQREVHKKYKYSAFSACLPTIVTLVIFFVVFSGFNSSVKYHNYVVYQNLVTVYNQTYEANIEGQPETSEVQKAAIAAAEQAVVDAYHPETFLLTKNIFMPDTWKQPIPTVETFTGTGMGNLGITGSIDRGEYNKVMQPLIDKYNTNEEGKNVWNGYLILPIIAFALSFLSSKLIRPAEQPAMAGQTEEQIKQQKSQQKMMTFMMPIIMGIFALFYSAAFTLYMVISNLYSTILNLVFNLVTKKIDAKRKDERLSTTVKN